MFRNEVLRARQHKALGGILIITPLPQWALTALALVVGVAISSFLFFGHYTRRVTVEGQLVPDNGVLTLVAPALGSVSRLLAEDGDQFDAGEVLLELVSDPQSQSGARGEIVASELREKQQRLAADLALQSRQSAQRQAALQSQLELLHAQAVELKAQVALQNSQIVHAEELLERIRTLRADGFASAAQVQQQQSTVLGLASDLADVVGKQLELRQRINAAQEELTVLPLTDERQRNQIRRDISSVQQELAENDTRRLVYVVSHSAGEVSTVLVSPGQMVTPGQPLLSVVPAGSRLHAQLLVPSRAIGFIEQGSRVVLSYQAFPFQRFGHQYGRVESVSRSALSLGEVKSLTGQDASEPLYRVRVELEHQSIVADGRSEALKPGMLLIADIQLERRTLLNWMITPLRGVGTGLLGGGTE